MAAKAYTLDIDGPLFRRQREQLLEIHALADEDKETLAGIIDLCDEIADQAHEHGVDCLLGFKREDGARE